MVDIKELRKEIDLKEDECCIVFDLGCYFPYANQDVLVFDFSLGEEKFSDYKKNHRYPNKGYQTISKKYGRKVSKVGYPYIMKLNEQHPMLLCVKIGLKDNENKNHYVSLVFPIETTMTKESPFCTLTLQYIFDDNKFTIYSTEEIEKGCRYLHRWLSEEPDVKEESDIVMNCRRVEDSFTLVYENVVTPYPLSKKGF